MRLNIYIFLLFFIIFSYSFGQNPLITEDRISQKKWVDSIYNSLSSDEKIGQLFTIWVATKQGPEQMDKVVEKIKKNHLGGLIFSLGNIKDQAKYTNKFQSISKVPLLIGMDAEWGLGMRLDDAFSFPFNMTLGAIEDDALIYKVGKRIGAHAKRLGVHMNYAPVTDINTNPNNPIIGSRSFGEDKFNVTNKALNYLRGMQSEGIMGSAKHFPGHGDTELDSHLTLPKINFSSKRIDEVELFPYRELIKNNLSSVMVAHMDMKGVVDFNKNRSADVDAILAGNDILLMPNDLDESTKNIKSALKSGIISEKRLEFSVKKILMAKYKAGLHDLNPVELENIVSEMNDDKDHTLFEEIIEKSITVIKNKKDIIPIKNLESKTAYISLGDSDYSEFYKSLNYYSKVDKLEYNSNQELLAKLKLYDQVIVGFHKSNKDPFQSYKFSKKELEILSLISKESNVILNVFAKPYALMDLKIDNISSVLISYQNNATAQSKSAQIIFGSIGSKGKLPVTINKSFPVNTSIKTKKLNRLSYGLPSSKIFNIQNLKKIDSIVDYAINQKMTPGAQVLIAKDGKVFFNKTYGFKTYQNNESVKWDDLYDVASLTKIVSSVPLLMNEFENGSITDETTLSDIINDINLKDKSDLSLKEMLSHQSGLFPWIPFYKETIDSLSKYPLHSYYSKKKTIISLLM